jgi:hypothetical protein
VKKLNIKTLLYHILGYDITNKQKKELQTMMEFKTIRSVSTFLENVDSFRSKFNAPYTIRDFTETNWMIHGKKIYWWDGEAKGDPQFNESIVSAQVFDDITVINIEDFRSGKHFSLICDNKNRKQ